VASVTINLSQDVIDQQHKLEQSNAAYDGSIGGMIGNLDYGIDQNIQFLSWNLSGSTLQVFYTGGVTETYTGVVRDNPNAASGHATATGYELRENGVVSVSTAGRLNFDYDIGNGTLASLTTSAQGHVLNTMRVATEFPSNSQYYDPTFGNVSIVLNGTLAMNAAGDASGTLNTITIGADKLLRSATVEGNLRFDPALPDGIAGKMTGYQENYYDGSAIKIAGLAADVNATVDLETAIFTNPGYFGGNDDINVSLPGRLYAPAIVQAGGGDDRIVLAGGGGQLGVSAGAGNDLVTLVRDAHTVDGGAGIDTVKLAAARSGITLEHTATGFNVAVAGGGPSAQLTNVERIALSGTTIALDIDGNGGQAYRLYQAAFDRTPDAAGLGFWIDALDKSSSLADVARQFTVSDEYRQAYSGATSNHDILVKFYENILHRAPDQGGLDFWMGVLDRGAGVAVVLAEISESPENKAGLADVIGNGFAYTPWV
jgi:hypothetical protein